MGFHNFSVGCVHFLGWGSHFCFQIFGYIFYLGDGELELRYYYFCKKKDMIQKDLYGVTYRDWETGFTIR